MDKVSAKKLLLKDINSLITHVNDILDSEDVGIDGYQADRIIEEAEDLRDYIIDELILNNADDEDDVEKAVNGEISKEDEEEWEKLLKDLDSSRSSSSYGNDSCGNSFHGSSCGSSSYDSSYGCSHSNSNC